MTSPNPIAKTPKPAGLFCLPEPPPREPDEVTSFDHLYDLGVNLHLARHLGNPETTLVSADRYIVSEPHSGTRRRPDLLVAFGVKPALYRAQNGYIISEQGKPPDFVLEVASVSTAEADVGEKRDYYESLLIPEYWRFDETGEYHGEPLAADQLLEGRYQPIAIETLNGRARQGYSQTLNLYLRWEQGKLLWIDPATALPILTYDDQLARAEQERARAEAAEARVQQLEAEVRRLRNS